MKLGRIGVSKIMHMPMARDYVQDGLIAMWDGIENAGWGVRDTTLKYWKDLIGGKKFIPWDSSSKYFGWDNDCPWAAARMTCSNFTIDALNGFSLEFVESFSYPMPGDFYGVVFFFDTNGSVYYKIRCLNFREPTANNSWEQDATKNTFLKNCTGIKSCSVISSNSTSTLRIGNKYLAGLPKINSGSLDLMIGYSNSSTIYRCYKNIRLYNRALNADEISANYAIDKVRFNLQG